MTVCSLRKTCSVFLIVIFTITNIAYGAPSERSFFKNKKVDYKKLSTQSQEQLEKKKAVLSGEDVKKTSKKPSKAKQIDFSAHLSDISEINIPGELGRVVEVYKAPDSEKDKNRLVVHIQDLHANPEATLNLASILEILVKDYNLDLICSEGAEGEVDTSSVSSFPDAEIRKKTAKLFVNSGELTGEEYLSITKYPDLPIWGIEDKDIYFNNIVQFNKIMQFSNSSYVFISQCTNALDALKPYIYSKEILELDQKESEYDNGNLETSLYLDYVLPYVEQFNISKDKYKNISLLTETMAKEKTIDQQKVMKESQDLLMDLQNMLSRKGGESDLEALIAKAELFKNKKISPFSFYNYLKGLAQKHLKEKSESYTYLNEFIDYLTKVNDLDASKLFTEIGELSYEIKDNLAKKDEEKLLTKVIRNAKFLTGFFSLKISNEELDYYLEDKPSFEVSFFKEFLEPNLKKYNITSYVDYNPEFIDNKFSEIEEFYGTVKSRDFSMFNNSMSQIESRRAKVAALISGGFHTRGITKLLREKGYSYVVISPYSSQETDEENYHFLLSGQRKPIEELIRQLDVEETVDRLSSNDNLRSLMRFGNNTVEAWNNSVVPQKIAEILGLKVEDVQLEPLLNDAAIVLGLSSGAEAWHSSPVGMEVRSPRKGEIILKFDDNSYVKMTSLGEVKRVDKKEFRGKTTLSITPNVDGTINVAETDRGKGSPLELLKFMVDGTYYEGESISKADLVAGRSFSVSTIDLEIKSLTELGLLKKNSDGTYELTSYIGLEQYNNIKAVTGPIVQVNGKNEGLNRYRIDDLSEDKKNEFKNAIDFAVTYQKTPSNFLKKLILAGGKLDIKGTGESGEALALYYADLAETFAGPTGIESVALSKNITFAEAGLIADIVDHASALNITGTRNSISQAFETAKNLSVSREEPRYSIKETSLSSDFEIARNLPDMYRDLSPEKIKDKIIIVRGNLNAPLDKSGEVSDPTRPDNIDKAVTYIIENGGTPVVYGHLMRRENNISMEPVASYLSDKYGQDDVVFHKGSITKDGLTISRNNIIRGKINILENIRLVDKENEAKLGRQIASLSEDKILVADALGDEGSSDVVHVYNAASEVYQGPEERREFSELEDTLKNGVDVVLFGGFKIEKLDLLLRLVDALRDGGVVLLGSGPSDHIRNDPEIKEQLKGLIDAGKIILAEGDKYYFNKVMGRDMPGDISSQDLERYSNILDNLKPGQRVLFNGTMGFMEKKDSNENIEISYREGTKKILEKVSEISEKGVKGLGVGGDGTKWARHYRLNKKENIMLSTGGGVSLSLITHEPLKGTKALSNRAQTQKIAKRDFSSEYGYVAEDLVGPLASMAKTTSQDNTPYAKYASDRDNVSPSTIKTQPAIGRPEAVAYEADSPYNIITQLQEAKKTDYARNLQDVMSVALRDYPELRDISFKIKIISNSQENLAEYMPGQEMITIDESILANFELMRQELISEEFRHMLYNNLVRSVRNKDVTPRQRLVEEAATDMQKFRDLLRIQTAEGRAALIGPLIYSTDKFNFYRLLLRTIPQGKERNDVLDILLRDHFISEDFRNNYSERKGISGDEERQVEALNTHYKNNSVFSPELQRLMIKPITLEEVKAYETDFNNIRLEYRAQKMAEKPASAEDTWTEVTKKFTDKAEQYERAMILTELDKIASGDYVAEDLIGPLAINQLPIDVSDDRDTVGILLSAEGLLGKGFISERRIDNNNDLDRTNPSKPAYYIDRMENALEEHSTYDEIILAVIDDRMKTQVWKEIKTAFQGTEYEFLLRKIRVVSKIKPDTGNHDAVIELLDSAVGVGKKEDNDKGRFLIIQTAGSGSRNYPLTATAKGNKGLVQVPGDIDGKAVFNNIIQTICQSHQLLDDTPSGTVTVLGCDQLWAVANSVKGSGAGLDILGNSVSMDNVIKELVDLGIINGVENSKIISDLTEEEIALRIDYLFDPKIRTEEVGLKWRGKTVAALAPSLYEMSELGHLWSGEGTYLDSMIEKPNNWDMLKPILEKGSTNFNWWNHRYSISGAKKAVEIYKDHIGEGLDISNDVLQVVGKEYEDWRALRVMQIKKLASIEDGRKVRLPDEEETRLKNIYMLASDFHKALGSSIGYIDLGKDSVFADTGKNTVLLESYLKIFNNTKEGELLRRLCNIKERNFLAPNVLSFGSPKLNEAFKAGKIKVAENAKVIFIDSDNVLEADIKAGGSLIIDSCIEKLNVKGSGLVCYVREEGVVDLEEGKIVADVVNKNSELERIVEDLAGDPKAKGASHHRFSPVIETLGAIKVAKIYDDAKRSFEASVRGKQATGQSLLGGMAEGIGVDEYSSIETSSLSEAEKEAITREALSNAIDNFTNLELFNKVLNNSTSTYITRNGQITTSDAGDLGAAFTDSGLLDLAIEAGMEFPVNGVVISKNAGLENAPIEIINSVARHSAKKDIFLSALQDIKSGTLTTDNLTPVELEFLSAVKDFTELSIFTGLFSENGPDFIKLDPNGSVNTSDLIELNLEFSDLGIMEYANDIGLELDGVVISGDTTTAAADMKQEFGLSYQDIVSTDLDEVGGGEALGIGGEEYNTIETSGFTEEDPMISAAKEELKKVTEAVLRPAPSLETRMSELYDISSKDKVDSMSQIDAVFADKVIGNEVEFEAWLRDKRNGGHAVVIIATEDEYADVEKYKDIAYIKVLGRDIKGPGFIKKFEELRVLCEFKQFASFNFGDVLDVSSNVDEYKEAFEAVADDM
ncbi:MAG: phosphoglycerate kinase [Candidatus Omnitrophota bacterium]